jgi:predicted amidophosphoribosyltransferase
MAKEQQGSVDSKTCPACGGTWPPDRRNCLACGTNLESVPARPAGEELEQEPLNWAWLDAMADEGTASEMPESGDEEQKPGCLARIFSR